MPAITRSQEQKELVPGLHALWGNELKRYDNQHLEIFEVNTSERAFEEELALSQFGAAPIKSEGSNIVYDQSQEFFTSRYQHNTIALAFAITEEAMEDNLYADVAKRNTKALAFSMNYTKQVICAAVLNNAFTAGYNGGDGVTLCSTSHPLVTGGTQSNRPTTGVDLNETALENAWIQMAGYVDFRGLLQAVMPKKLIVPKDYAFTAERLLKTVLRTGTADNDINAVVSRGMIPEGYAVNNYLTDTNAGFLTTTAPDGMKYFQRVKLSFADQGDFETGNLKFKARERYSAGWSNPLGLYGSPGVS